MSVISHYSKIFHDNKICVIIPSYNNAGTIKVVLTKVLKYTKQVIVVNDGSTDNTSRILRDFEFIEVITTGENKGKGHAMRTGFDFALSKGFDYAITLDSDGQHFPEDLPVFIDRFEKNQNALLVGSRNLLQNGVPGRSNFGNRFSNFWYKIETGIKLPDTQSGFRLYPIKFYKDLKFFTNRFEFEIEILVRSAWQGIHIVPVPIQVFYYPKEERISHFRPFRDFFRISILNTILVLISLLYIKPRDLYRYIKNNSAKKIIKDLILEHNETGFKVSLAVGFGVFMGIVPIWGFQMIVAAFLAHWFRLNKALVIVASNISIPPMIPLILFLSYKTGGLVLNNNIPLNIDTFSNLKMKIISGEFYEALSVLGYSISQYVIGSFAFGFICGLLLGIITYILLLYYKATRH